MSLIGRRIGNYEIKAKIGEGGMGTVYLGEHPLIGKRVAIKVLLEELVAKQDVVSRFFNEAKAVNDIGHQNIVDVVDFGKTPGERGEEIVYFIMEFLDGEPLSSRIRRAGLPFKDTLHMMSQCCSALAASHAKGVVHRDLKPENIFLIGRGNDKNFIKILDFGIAKLTGDGGTSSHKTRTGLVIGTPTYMSPEQCEGKGLIDHRSDVYSLGIVMYELLTGCVPFPGDGFGEVLVAHLTKQPAKPSSVNANIPPAIESIVLHAIEKDRNRRFQNMNEFLEAVENPDAHHAKWTGLPDYSSAAPTLQTMPKAPANLKQGRTLSLDDVGPASAGGGPRPTTLEGAAAEVTLSPTRVPRNRAPVIAVVTCVMALAGIGGYFAVFGKKGDAQPGAGGILPQPQPPQQAEAPKPQPEAARPVAALDDSVVVVVTSDPSGAKVFRADKSDAETERTPITFKLHKGDPPFDIQLRLEGHLSATRTITSDESVKMVVSLAKIPGVTARPVADAPEATPEAKPQPRVVSAKVPNVASPTAVASPKPKKPKAPKVTAPKTTSPTDDDMTIIQPNF